MGALELMARPDVMAELSDWRGGQALGTSNPGDDLLQFGPRPDHRAQGRPQLVRARGAAIERFWLSAELEGLSAQPVSPLFLYARTEVDLLNLGGERHLDEMYELSKRFHEAWDLEEGETMAMVLRVIHAPPPSVHSIRRPLGQVLSRIRRSP
jgi:hypothetical protein